MKMFTPFAYRAEEGTSPPQAAKARAQAAASGSTTMATPARECVKLEAIV